MEEPLINRTRAFPESGADGETPVYTARYPSENELERRARQVGTIIGQAVALVRRPRRFVEPGSQVRDLQARASERVVAVRNLASIRAEQWRRTAREKSAEIGRRAKAGYEQAVDRTTEFGHNNPWHVLAIAGIAGFILGVLLRVRRANHGV